MQAAQLAAEKATSQAVKDLGAGLAADHAANHQHVQRLAAHDRGVAALLGVPAA